MARSKELDCLNCCKLPPKEARERYSTVPEAVARGELRPLRNPKENA